MPPKNEAHEIITTLERNNFLAECPCCGENIHLKDASLFYLNDFTPQAEDLYKERLNQLAIRSKEIRDSKMAIPRTSQVAAQAINIGFILERIAPVLKAFQFEHNDCRALFDPIDYVVFEGLKIKGKVDRVVFIYIKSGSAQLTNKQKAIRSLVEKGCVEWDTYEMGESS
jgi:predicted Holliday junction resolvase-like endonuclease